MKALPMYRKNQFAIVLVAMIACVVTCMLAFQPLSAYAADSASLIAGTPAQVSTAADSTAAPAKAKIASIKSSKAGQIIVKAAKVSGASGYQYKIALNKGLSSGAKSKTTTAKSFTFKNRAQGYKYYAKVRAYKVVNGKKVYGPWSAAKSIKVKSGKTAAICKSRLLGKWELVSATGEFKSTLKQLKSMGARMLVVVKGNKLYLGTVYQGKTKLDSNYYTWTASTASKAIGKRTGYVNLTMKVTASKLVLSDKSGTFTCKRL